MIRITNLQQYEVGNDDVTQCEIIGASPYASLPPLSLVVGPEKDRFFMSERVRLSRALIPPSAKVESSKYIPTQFSLMVGQIVPLVSVRSSADREAKGFGNNARGRS